MEERTASPGPGATSFFWLWLLQHHCQVATEVVLVLNPGWIDSGMNSHLTRLGYETTCNARYVMFSQVYTCVYLPYKSLRTMFKLRSYKLY